MNMKLRKVFLFVAAFFAVSMFAQEQQMPQMPQLTDPNVRMGKLENGLTYYVRHNDLPKGQADFHIAQKVGAVQENEEQNGLAHFLEHMCFNGTKNYPDKLILTWLESIGVKFGYNLNAHTATDETVYDIMNVPLARETVIDSCLLILHDWSCDLTLADEEIEKERGVIHEEWRTGNNATKRMLTRHAQELYPGTKYATHDVIGSMDIVDNFHPDVLRAYYKKWYRPDLQAIIVVGDVDVDKVEQKIKDMFSPIKMPENAAKFEKSYLGDNAEPVVISESDAEMSGNVLLVAQKFDKLPREYRNTDMGLITDFMDNVVNQMMNQRLSEIYLGNDAPFASAGGYIGDFLYAATKGALILQASVSNEKGTEAALDCVLTELRRMKDFGFTASEYDRARNEYLSQLEKAYENRGTVKNGVYAQGYIQHFINNEAIAPIEYEYEKMKMIVPMIPVEGVNEYVKEMLSGSGEAVGAPLGKNLVVLSMAPIKEGVKVPTKEELSAVIAKVNGAKVEAYVDESINEPLISQLPQPGKIVSTVEDAVLGTKELTLSNGVKVVLKPTKFKENEIIFSAKSHGGASLYSAEDVPSIELACDVITSTGIGKFSISDLQKLMSGKQASVSPSIGGYSEGMSGRSTVKDFETMMQLIYLNFTQPREDEEAANNIKKIYLSQLDNLEKNPDYIFGDSLTRAVSGYHPKAVTMSKELVEKANYKRMLEIYKERFANAADFTFVFVGNFDEALMNQYLEQYIATLPATEKREVAANDGQATVKGKVRKEFVFKNESQTAKLAMVWSGNVPYTRENKILASIVSQLMSNELLNSVREEEGAAYSPYASAYVSRTYYDEGVIQAVFGLNPTKAKIAEKLTIQSLEKLSKDVKEEELQKMKEFMLKQYKQNTQENGYWLGTVMSKAVDGIDNYTGYVEYVNKVTTEQIEKFIADFLKQGNRFEMIMLPE